jgi:hypothetical protein
MTRTVGIDFFARKGACLMGGGHHAGDGFLDSERGRSWAAAPDPNQAA